MRINPEGREFGNKEMLPIPKELDEELVNKAGEHLGIIKDSLHDFTERIREEEPDMVICLDKGARIFGEPVFKYLDEKKMSKMPEIRFFNDDYLKGLYLDGKLDQDAVESELSCLKGKKVFFLDETFSSGKGAGMLKKAKEFLGDSDISYFALTQDKGPKVLDEFDVWYNLPTEEHLKNLEDIKKDPNFKIYDNDIGALFSKEASNMYVTEADEDGKVRTIGRVLYGSSQKIKAGGKEIVIPNPYDSDERYEYPCDKKEYFRLKEKEKQNTINIIKEKILETLKSGE